MKNKNLFWQKKKISRLNKRHVADSMVKWRKVVWSSETKIDLLAIRQDNMFGGHFPAVKHGGQLHILGILPGRLVNIEGKNERSEILKKIKDSSLPTSRELRRLFSRETTTRSYPAKAAQKWFKDNIGGMFWSHLVKAQASISENILLDLEVEKKKKSFSQLIQPDGAWTVLQGRTE